MNMKTKLNWKKRFFGSTNEIFSGETRIGKLTEKTWTQSADAEMKGEKYQFLTKGFLNKETLIIDATNKMIIGKITYNSFRTIAQIEYRNKQYSWKSHNWINSKWSLTNNEDVQIEYSGGPFKGRLETDSDEFGLILTGLFVSNYFQQSMVAIFIVMYIVLFASN